jgi:hypothetical protein|tara:strand:- start:412 stop:756 length:345 start_codon:yes stop_codon:yes gene_type:complete
MRKRFNLGGGADMGRDKKVPKVPDMNKRTTDRKLNLDRAMKVLEKEKGKPKDPTQPRVKGPTVATPLGLPSIVKAIIKGSRKFTKKNPDKVKEIMKKDLPDKTKELLKKLKEKK